MTQQSSRRWTIFHFAPHRIQGGVHEHTPGARGWLLALGLASSGSTHYMATERP